MSPAQAERFRLRVEAQAAGERASGTAYTSGSFQIVWSLINKGRVFEQIMNHDPEAVQAGPLIERLVTETIGGGWSNLNGGAANIASRRRRLKRDESLCWYIELGSATRAGAKNTQNAPVLFFLVRMVAQRRAAERQARIG